MANNFAFGKTSMERRAGVHPHFLSVMDLALTLSTMDFALHCGVRTDEEQHAKFRAGASEIDGLKNKGRHQIGADGFGHAGDLVPYFEGQLQWEWPLIFPVADAVRAAAKQLAIPIRWGGTWTELTASKYNGMSAKQIYDTRPSWDGAHFELPSAIYP